jgi:glycopeptide antibiotics resistance protein
VANTRATRSIMTANILYMVVILFATLAPIPWAALNNNQLPLGVLDPDAWLTASTWTVGSPIEAAVNLLMFVPIGVFAALVLRGGWRWIGPALLSAGIEIAQIVHPDRISDPRDLVINTSGALLGVLAVSLARRPARTIVRLSSELTARRSARTTGSGSGA